MTKQTAAKGMDLTPKQFVAYINEHAGKRMLLTTHARYLDFSVKNPLNPVTNGLIEHATIDEEERTWVMLSTSRPSYPSGEPFGTHKLPEYSVVEDEYNVVGGMLPGSRWLRYAKDAIWVRYPDGSAFVLLIVEPGEKGEPWG